jgi:hypothetical protein
MAHKATTQQTDQFHPPYIPINIISKKKSQSTIPRKKQGKNWKNPDEETQNWTNPRG